MVFQYSFFNIDLFWLIDTVVLVWIITIENRLSQVDNFFHNNFHNYKNTQ